MRDLADGVDADGLTPVELLGLTGPLPLDVVECICGLEAIEQQQRLDLINVESSGAAMVALQVSVPEILAAERIRGVRRVAEVLVSVTLPKMGPDVSLRLANLLQQAGQYDLEIIRNGARAALMRGDAAAASSLSRHGLTHEPTSVELLHLQAMALEALGRHGAASGIDSHQAGMNDPAWLGRWASNLFLSTGRVPAAEQLASLDDERQEMKAALAWIEALQGDVAVVAKSVNNVLDDPRSSSQAVVWACVAGAVPAALDGRARVAEAMIAHCRSVVDEVGEQLSPFADLQIGLVEALSQVRLGRLVDAVSGCERHIAMTDSSFIAAVWSFFAAIARREIGDFEAALRHFERGFAAVDADPFGLILWAQSEAGACSVMRDRSSATRLDAVVSMDAHGLFRPCLLRNAAWIKAARGEVDEAIEATLLASACALELGQNVHVALALLDLARFGSPHRASTMLTRISEFDAPILGAVAQATAALDGGHSEALGVAAGALRNIGMALQADELIHRARHAAAREANLWQIARFDLFDEPVIRPTPIFDEYERPSPQLTDREREVARHCGAGVASRDIAQLLGNSTRTVDNLLGRVYRKCAFDDRRELGAWYQRYVGSQPTRPL